MNTEWRLLPIIKCMERLQLKKVPFLRNTYKKGGDYESYEEKSGQSGQSVAKVWAHMMFRSF